MADMGVDTIVKVSQLRLGQVPLTDSSDTPVILTNFCLFDPWLGSLPTSRGFPSWGNRNLKGSNWSRAGRQSVV